MALYCIHTPYTLLVDLYYTFYSQIQTVFVNGHCHLLNVNELISHSGARHIANLVCGVALVPHLTNPML